MTYRYRYLDPESIIGSDDFKVVESFIRGTGRTQIGWHYIVDLTWIYSKAKGWPIGASVLDAGGGRGPAQFMLAELGFNVTNVDLVHMNPSYVLRRRYGVELSKLASYADTEYVEHLLRFRGSFLALLKKARNAARESVFFRDHVANGYDIRHNGWRKKVEADDTTVGNISWVIGNLGCMPEIENASFDAVVSLSSLEHIPLEYLPAALAEIQRVLKPQAFRAITTSATGQCATWFHHPSKGYCFSTADLQKIFSSTPADNSDAETVLKKYRSCEYLKNNLATFYRLSGRNGMPWGQWRPQYIPVGIYG
jgi:2-polyprenyl-3-methyl-5-hydroxy-6-metoxy-1,4-benzoquinol methylase